MAQRQLVDLVVSGDPRRRLRTLVWLLVLLLVALGSLSAAMLWEMRHEACSEGVTSSRNVVTAEASDIEQTLRIYDASLHSAAEAVNDPKIMAAAPRMRQRALFDRIEDPSFLGPIRIIEPNERVTADSAQLAPAPTSQAEQEALARHWLDPAARALIGLPTPDGADHVVTISRRIMLPDGRFDGIACGTMRLGYLTDRFRHLRLGPHDVISLFLGDGVMLAHAPGDPLVGRRITGSEVMRRFGKRSSGTVVAPAAVDGVERVFTFAHLSGWPLLVDVGLSVSDLYAPWRERAAVVGLLLSGMVFAGGLLALMLRHEVNVRVAAEEATRRSEAQYRALADGASDIILRLDADGMQTYASPSVWALGPVSS